MQTTTTQNSSSNGAAAAPPGLPEPLPDFTSGPNDAPSDEVICTGYVNVIGSGPIRRVTPTPEADEALRKLPACEKTPRTAIRETATFEGSDGRQAAAQLAATQVKANKDWSYVHQVAGSVLLEVRPWLEAAEAAVAQATSQAASSLEERIVRVGGWRDLCQFRHLPSLSLIPVQLSIIGVGLGAEMVCGMIYVAAGFPDLVGLQLGGLPWLTPALIAFCLTAAFVFGPFVLLKRLPSRLSAAEKPLFHARFRLASKVLLAISPITYAWTLGVAKEYMPQFVNGELIPPPLSPGMTGFICCAMFLITFTSAAAAEWLKETIDSLYKLERESVPQREYAETAAGEAHVALASCRGLVHRAETAIEAVKAAEKNLEVSCQAALQSEQSHLNARKLQAFVIPSRN